MTYEHILEIARQHTRPVPPFREVWDARLRPVNPIEGLRARAVHMAVLGVAGLLSLWSLTIFGREAWSLSSLYPARFLGAMGALVILTVGFLGPIVLAMRFRNSQDLVRQVLLRAVCWSMLELCVMATFMAGPDPVAAPGLLVGALFFGGLLLALGSRGLEQLHGTFQPIAYRGRLLATLVLAFADAQTLTILTGLQLGMGFVPTHMVVIPAVGAAAMIVAVVGLARLRGWALAFNVLVNLAVAGLALAGYVATTRVFVYGLVGTAIVQVILVAPLLRAALGRPVAVSHTAEPHFRWAAAAVVVLMVAAVAATAITLYTGKILVR